MIPKALPEILATDIEALIQVQRMEDQWLDYKLELPSKSEKDIHSLLSDVTALANSMGGDLIYGIDEQRDDDNHPTGIPKTAVGLDIKNLDLERTRLQQTIHSRLDPAPRISFRFIDGFKKGPVLVLRVDRALNGPLMIRTSSRFYVRRHTQNVPLERVSDIRDLILGAGSIAQRVREFRADRLAMLTRGESPIPLPDEPLLLVHAIPASAALQSLTFNVNDLAKASHHLIPRGGNIASRPNLDGHFSYLVGDFEPFYIQAFRSGAIESADAGIGANQQQRTLPGGYIDKRILQYLKGCGRALEGLGVDLPFYFSVSLMNIDGYLLLGPSGMFYRLRPSFDRLLVSAEIEVNEWPKDLGLAAKPILDLIWQAAGHPEDPYVADDGTITDI